MCPTDSETMSRDEQSSTEAVLDKHRQIQREQDQRDAEQQQSGGSSDEQAVQAGLREQPSELPSQHLEKPGLEAEMELKPRFEAPDYEGSNKLRDMVAIITGADSGIGRAVAVLFAREGADVAVVYLSSHEDAEETKRHVEAEGRRCLLIAGNVKDSAFCQQAVEQTVQEFGKLDILVNNAGFQQHAMSIEDISDERFDETVRTNVYGYFYMARAALKHMKKGASIINTGSVVGLEGSAKLLDYSTTKGAVHAFTKALAQNVVSKGIRVNAVAPGPVWTPFNPADNSSEMITEFGKETDMKRPAQPEELSPAYVFLASPVCSPYVTGIVLPVTGSVGAI